MCVHLLRYSSFTAIQRVAFLLLVTLSFSTASLSREPIFVSAQLTAQMSQNGKVDTDRLFVFYFSHWTADWATGEEACSFQSITFNNLSCNPNSPWALFPPNAFWAKPEFCTKEWCGKEFTCESRRLADDRIELVVRNAPSGLTHHLVLDQGGSEVLDYSGALSKQSGITNQIETAQYTPLRSKSLMTFDATKVGCGQLSVPKIKPSQKAK